MLRFASGASRASISRATRAGSWRRFGGASTVTSALRVQQSTYSTKADSADQTVNEASQDESLPWYLRDNASSPVSTPMAAPLPEIPAGAPPEVLEYMTLLSKEYGLDDIQIFHVDEKDQQLYGNDDTDKNSSYNIICSGKSDKHIYKAANEFRMFVKHRSDGETIPKLEGFVSHSSRNANYRRMLRRARKGPMATDNDYGMGANSWIMCDVGLGVYIHILTVERRTELDLELLWTEGLNELGSSVSQRTEPLSSDDLFIGIRRQYHTKLTFRRNFHTEALEPGKPENNETIKNLGQVQSVYNEIMKSLEPDIESLLTKLDSTSLTSIDDFQSKFELYLKVHLHYPELVSLDQVVSTIWEKYIYFALNKDVNLEAERIQDSINVMKLILDTPEQLPRHEDMEEDERQLADIQLNYLSNFLRQLFIFSGEKLTPSSITKSPEFLVLLWGFVIIDKNNFIGPNVVDKVMQGHRADIDTEGETNHSISVYRARGILDLLELNQIPTTREFDELVLYTLGNSNLSSMFWEYWERTQILYVNSDSTQGLTKWVRLIVYLSLHGSVKLQTHFLSEKWAQQLGNFLSVFHEVGSFKNENERKAFQSAIVKMISNVRRITQDEAYKGILDFASEV